MRENVMRLDILPRAFVRYYQAPTPAYWDMRKLNSKWYWRALSWVLKKLGGEFREYIPESWPIHEVKIDQGSIIKMLETSKSAMQYLWDKRATTLVLGYDEMDRLMKEAPTEMMRFDMRFPIGRHERSEYDTQYRFVSRTVHLRVVLVPWLSGWALLPDLGEWKGTSE